MIHLVGATVVLPDRLLAPGRVSIHHGHITEVETPTVDLKVGDTLAR